MPTQFGDIVKDKIASGGYRTSFAVSLINGMMVSGCETILTQNNTLAQLRKSDLIIGISSLFCGSLVAEYLNKPYVIIYPAIFAGFYSFAMIPSPPSYVPVIQSDLTDRMTFVERVKNVVLFGIKELMLYFIIFPEYKRFQEKFSIHPDKNLGEIIGMAEIHIVLSDFSNEFTHPLMPNTFYVGPILPRPPNALSKDLEKVMQSSGKEGVVVVSFGSELSVLPEHILKTMASAFGKLKQTVIWKMKIPSGIKISQNIKLYTWIPQNDLLGHPKTVAFVGHMGVNGAYEASYHGVPVVAAPVVADGYETAIRLCKKGRMAKFIDIYTADVDAWLKIINEVLYNTEYKQNAERVSKLIKSSPRTPTERATDLIDYVLDNGGRVPHLRAYAHNLSWYQYHNMDVIFLLALILLIVLFMISKICKCCCAWFHIDVRKCQEKEEITQVQ